MGITEVSIIHHAGIVLLGLWLLSEFNLCHPVAYFISLIYLYLVIVQVHLVSLGDLLHFTLLLADFLRCFMQPVLLKSGFQSTGSNELSRSSQDGILNDNW